MLLFLYVSVGGQRNNDWLPVLDSLTKIKCFGIWLKMRNVNAKQEDRECIFNSIAETSFDFAENGPPPQQSFS